MEGDLTPEALRDQIEATTGWVGIDGTYNMTAEDHNGLDRGRPADVRDQRGHVHSGAVTDGDGPGGAVTGAGRA